MLAGLLALATTIGIVATPIAPLRYKIEMKALLEADLAAMGQGKMTGDMTLVAFVSVAMSDSAGGQLAHVVVDSMTVAPNGMMQQQGLDASQGATAKGAFFHLFVIGGKVQGTAKPSMDGNAALTALGQGVTMLFPGQLKDGLKPGDTFADTATTSTTTEQGTNNNSAITLWTVKGAEGDALVLDGVSTGKMSIDGPASAASGTSKGTRVMTSSLKGPIKHTTINNATDLAVVPAGMSDPIPVKNIADIVITQIN